MCLDPNLSACHDHRRSTTHQDTRPVRIGGSRCSISKPLTIKPCRPGRPHRPAIDQHDHRGLTDEISQQHGTSPGDLNDWCVPSIVRNPFVERRSSDPGRANTSDPQGTALGPVGLHRADEPRQRRDGRRGRCCRPGQPVSAIARHPPGPATPASDLQRAGRKSYRSRQVPRGATTEAGIPCSGAPSRRPRRASPK